VEAREERRQPAERPNAKFQNAVLGLGKHGLLRFVQGTQNVFGIAKKQFAPRRQHQYSSAFAEQRNAQTLFKLLDAGRDIVLNSVQSRGRPHNLALANHSAEDFKGGQIMASHF